LTWNHGLIHGSRAHPNPHLKQISIGSGVFAGLTIVTDRQTTLLRLQQ